MSDERVGRLEERLAWLERHVTAQDKAMLELHDDLARLRAIVSALQNREPAQPDPSGSFDAASDTPPPHY